MTPVDNMIECGSPKYTSQSSLRTYHGRYAGSAGNSEIRFIKVEQPQVLTTSLEVNLYDFEGVLKILNTFVQKVMAVVL